MEPLELIPVSRNAMFLETPHDKRWEKLRPVIESLRTGTHSLNSVWTIPKIANFMKQHYNFDATSDAYSYRFRKWKITKRVLKAEKETTITALARRPDLGSSTGRVSVKQGNSRKTVESKVLRRHLQEQLRHASHVPVALQPGVFSSWTLPYAAYLTTISRRFDMPSPFGNAGRTPENLNIDSPEAASPGRLDQGPSPTMQLIRQRDLQQRTSFLLQGRTLELLGKCSREDRSIIVNQLHNLHVQCFVAAKYWGRGPQVWTARMAADFTWRNMADTVISPSGAIGTPQNHTSSQGARLPASNAPLPVPTNSCRWSIHARHLYYEALPEPVPVENINSQEDRFDLEHPEQWPNWSEQSQQQQSYTDTIIASIANTPFTSGLSGSSLLSQTRLSTALNEGTKSLAIDSIRLAIMAGNADLLCEQLDRDEDKVLEKVKAIYPFHLAASYLDGGSGCCSIFSVLQRKFTSGISDYERDDMGHTTIDKLVLSIIRSHTSIRLDQIFRHKDGPKKFPGEEKDICGRWDADSPEIHALFAAGFARVPTTWKHPFCHTAVQAVCHACIVIYASPSVTNIGSTSGLFERHCFVCGEKLALGPLHLMVVTAFYLAENGMPGETLFGILAVAVCLISLGADPRQSASISPEDFLSGDHQEACRHANHDPAELMQTVPHSISSRWTDECQTGWFCMLSVLQLGTKGEDQQSGSGSTAVDIDTSSNPPYTPDIILPDETMGEILETDSMYSTSNSSNSRSDCELCEYGGINIHEEWLHLPCTTPKMGLLWACIQTELLTYRKLVDTDSWISGNFSMKCLRLWLEGKSESFETLLVTQDMMKPHSRCGWFFDAEGDFILPIAEDTCGKYFMNMEDFRRSSFLGEAELLDKWRSIL